MKKTSIFEGAATAIITPLTEKGVDYVAFEKLLKWQVAQGIDALVICGTTGEGSTLSDQEHREVLKFAMDTVGGQVPMIAGTGSNDCAYAIDLTKFACEIGYDAMLEIRPRKKTRSSPYGLIVIITLAAYTNMKHPSRCPQSVDNGLS